MLRTVSAPSMSTGLLPLAEADSPVTVPLMPVTSAPVPALNSLRGVIRQMDLVTKRIAGLVIWEANVQDFFDIVCLRKSSEGKIIAREIVRSFSLDERQKHCRKDDDADRTRRRNLRERTLCLTGSELQVLEESWMGEIRQADDSPSIPADERFFSFISFECSLSSSWEVVKQITYLAITKAALDRIVARAQYHRSGPVLPDFLDTWEKSFADKALQDCMYCLSSASPTQSLLAAISARSLSISCRYMTNFVHEDASWLDPVGLLDFDVDYSWGQGSVVENLVKTIQRRKMDFRRVQSLAPEHRTRPEEQRQMSLQSDFGFCRAGTRTDPIRDGEQHVASNCLRCSRSDTRNYNVYHEPWNNGSLQTMNGMVLISAPDANQKPEGGYVEQGICLFLLDESTTSDMDLLIEDTLQNMIAAEQMYHSIRAPKRGSFNHLNNKHWPYVAWNLPVPYRQNFPWETCDVKNWLEEHREGRKIPEPDEWDMPRDTASLMLLEGVMLQGQSCEMVMQQIMRRTMHKDIPQREGLERPGDGNDPTTLTLIDESELPTQGDQPLPRPQKRSRYPDARSPSKQTLAAQNLVHASSSKRRRTGPCHMLSQVAEAGTSGSDASSSLHAPSSSSDRSEMRIKVELFPEIIDLTIESDQSK